MGDFSLVAAWKGDRLGNLVYRKAARNFNPMAATAGKVSIAEVEELVEVGALDPESVHTPGVFVQRVVVAPRQKRIERRTVRKGAKRSERSRLDRSLPVPVSPRPELRGEVAGLRRSDWLPGGSLSPGAIATRWGRGVAHLLWAAPMLDREGIIRRAAKELQDGYTVNLGIGMPTLLANHIPPEWR